MKVAYLDVFLNFSRWQPGAFLPVFFVKENILTCFVNGLLFGGKVMGKFEQKQFLKRSFAKGDE